MKAGRLRHRIQILYRNGFTLNECNEEVPKYEPFRTVWASIEPLRGKEYLEAEKINAEISHRIVIRYLPGLKPEMKIGYEGRIFEIESIINIDERNREIQLMCIEKVE